ncbi:tol-pal system YbgF family protein [Candidatus Poribacteria bacterium]
MRDRRIGLWAYGLMSLFCAVCFASYALGDSNEEVDYYSSGNILKFADYLYQEGDYLRAAGEYQRHLFHYPQNADSTLYKLGFCYRLAGDTERAIHTFRKIVANKAEGRFRSAASYQIAYSYFLSRQYEKSLQYLDEAVHKAADVDERGKLQILSAFNYLHQKRWHDAEDILSGLDLKDEELSRTALSLRASAQDGARLPRKSPILAGLMSTVVPGAGKFYCGQYGDGLYSLFLAGATGLLAWDGFRDDGLHSIRGWVLGSMGAIFYTGNVYGSVIAARVRNHRLEVGLLRSLPAAPDG